MSFTWNKSRDEIDLLTDRVLELGRELELERTKRVSAESLLVEMRKRADFAEETARKANERRDEVIEMRLKSLDLFNLKLAEAQNPSPAVDFSQMKPLKSAPLNAVARMRKSDRDFLKNTIARQSAPAPQVDPTPQAEVTN